MPYFASSGSRVGSFFPVVVFLASFELMGFLGFLLLRRGFFVSCFVSSAANRIRSPLESWEKPTTPIVIAAMATMMIDEIARRKDGGLVVFNSREFAGDCLLMDRDSRLKSNGCSN
jgi:hypothetical protein